MTTRTPSTYLDVAESAWRWVLDQVRWDGDGPWIPGSVTPDGESDVTEAPDDRDGMHSGVGGLAHALAEIALTRVWTAEEVELAAAVADRVRGRIPLEVDSTFFDGLGSSIGVLTALGEAGVDAAVARLRALATPDGWPQRFVVPPRYLPDARLSDLTLGTAGVLLAALWARRAGAPGATELAEHAAAVLIGEAVARPGGGTDWDFVPQRFRTELTATQMPNLSHGVAGIATALALAGAELGRPDLVAAARGGAEHLVALGDPGDGGFVVPRYLPLGLNDEEPVTYTWCHGASGTSLLFVALDLAGIAEVAGVSPLDWHRRCLVSVATSGLPERLRPGFWDNDGRCCGTAGVAEVFLDSWQRTGEQDDLDFALHLTDALVERAVHDGSHAYWCFVEHRAADPLLPPGVGWMQGAAGIAATLFRAARVVRDGPAAAPVARMDTWWAQGR